MSILGNRAHLVHSFLPPYEIPDLITVSVVVVENRGGADAPNVKVTLEYDAADATKISHMQVISDEEYILRGGGEQHSFATIRLRKLGAGKRLTIYFASTRAVEPRVKVTSYEG
jgi:hypothetical protein